MFPYRLDIWDNIVTEPPFIRSSIADYTTIGGICSSNQYSLIEFSGINSIVNAARVLGNK